MDMHTRNLLTTKQPQAINANRVYINPYFNSHHKTNPALRENTYMHLNPKFTTLIPHNSVKNNSNTRIFINPNFMKSTWGNPSNKLYPYNTVNNLVESNTEPIKDEPKLPVPDVDKSRYSLVRHGTTIVKEIVKDKQLSKTIKISKYKSVPLTDIKNKIMKEHNTLKTYSGINHTKILPQSQKYLAHTEHTKKNINRYKYVKGKPALVPFEGCNKRVVNGKTSTAIARKNYRHKIKEAKKVFKKNNIPCPLFRKFGKCLRNNHGHCEFLHDKRHVTLCRKFLKGICFDTDCLLSHDSTTKKMPTCYFYLKGMCTKIDCPYVHIKLNDNSKICPDFLKGYCEKGTRCTSRHVTAASYTKKQSCYKYKKIDKPKVRKKSICLENKLTDKQNKLNGNHSNEQKGNIKEGRYYEDQEKWNDNAKDMNEVIKPTRCKLGSLPSFIQLHD